MRNINLVLLPASTFLFECLGESDKYINIPLISNASNYFIIFYKVICHYRNAWTSSQKSQKPMIMINFPFPSKTKVTGLLCLSD